MARKKQSPAAVQSAVLVLCAALFAWRLHGKLSGDKGPNQSHPKSVVKPIQDDETQRLAVSAQDAPRSPLLDSVDLAAVRSQPRLIANRNWSVRKPAPDTLRRTRMRFASDPLHR